MITDSTSQPRRVYSYVAQPHFYNDHYDLDRRNTQDGPISIAFTRSSRRSIHTSNDCTRGVVHVKAREQIRSVVIKFIGRTTCRALDGDTRTEVTAKTELFRHEKVLRQRESPSPNCPPGRVEYPFEFHFPEFVELKPTLQNNAPYTPDDDFEHEEGHQLPPSFWWKENTVRSEYFLEAEFLPEQASGVSKSVVIHQLRYSPSVLEGGFSVSTPPLPALLIELGRRHRLSNLGPIRERRGSLEKLKATLRGADKVEAVSLNLVLMLDVPSQYRVSGTNNITLALQSKRNNCASPPAVVYLRGIRAQATAHIKYRIPTAVASSGGVWKHDVDTFDLFHERYSKPGIEIGVSTTLGPFEINKIVPPTFKTYGVAVTYDVRYTLLLECAGKETEHELGTRGVPILPMTRPADYTRPPQGPPPSLETNTDVDDGTLETLLQLGIAEGSADVPPPYSCAA